MTRLFAFAAAFMLAVSPAAFSDETPVLNAELSAAIEAGGSLVIVGVTGMVCDLCAVAMTRTFGRRGEVAAVHVDLDAKTLQIVERSGQTLSDDAIEDLVRRSGYRMTALQRAEES